MSTYAVAAVRHQYALTDTPAGDTSQRVKTPLPTAPQALASPSLVRSASAPDLQAGRMFPPNPRWVAHPPALLASLPAPIATSSAALAKQLAPIYEAYIATHVYNRIGVTSAFVRHLDALRRHAPTTSAVEALTSFPVSSAELAHTTGSGQCYGLAHDLARTLRTAGFSAALVPGRNYEAHAGEPFYAHAAVLVPFANPHAPSDTGVFLLDPGYRVPSPQLLLKSGAETRIEKGNDVWTFALQRQPSGRWRVLWRDAATGKMLREFRCAQLRNGEQALVAPYIASDPTPIIIHRGADSKLTGMLMVDLAESVVVLTTAGTTTKVPFDSIAPDAQGRWLTDDFAAKLALPAEVVRRDVRDLVLHARDLQLLREANGKSLSRSPAAAGARSRDPSAKPELRAQTS